MTRCSQHRFFDMPKKKNAPTSTEKQHREHFMVRNDENVRRRISSTPDVTKRPPAHAESRHFFHTLAAPAAATIMSRTSVVAFAATQRHRTPQHRRHRSLCRPARRGSTDKASTEECLAVPCRCTAAHLLPKKGLIHAPHPKFLRQLSRVHDVRRCIQTDGTLLPLTFLSS